MCFTWVERSELWLEHVWWPHRPDQRNSSTSSISLKWLLVDRIRITEPCDTVTSVWVKSCLQSLSWSAGYILTLDVSTSFTFILLSSLSGCASSPCVHTLPPPPLWHHIWLTSVWPFLTHSPEPTSCTNPCATMALSSRLKLWEQKGGAELLHAALIGHLIFDPHCMCVLCSRTWRWLHAWIITACHCEASLLVYYSCRMLSVGAWAFKSTMLSHCGLRLVFQFGSKNTFARSIHTALFYLTVL